MLEPLRIAITGASSGIGAALVDGLAGDGHSLFICARRAERLPQGTRRLSHIAGHACDVSDEGQVIEFMVWVEGQTPYLDALINCAGTLGAIGPITETNSTQWLETLRVNLFGAYLMIKHAIPLLEGSAAPRIINFSGGGAFNPFPNYTAYACSKAGVIRLTESLAVELAPRGFRVNAVAPGFVATPLHAATLNAGPEKAGAEQYELTLKGIKAGRGPQPALDCVRFLLSSQADALTGKTLSANFDPWQEPEFQDSIAEINDSDLFTMRRVMMAPGMPPLLTKLLEEAEERRPSLFQRKPPLPPRR